MNEKSREIMKGRIVSILFEEGEEEVNLSSRVACEKIADRILKSISILLLGQGG